MTIRKATAADAWDIARIHVDSWKSTYQDIFPNEYIEKITVESRHGHWQKEIAAGFDILVSSDAAGNVRGWIAFGRDRELPDSRETAEIQAMYLDPHCVRKGLGSDLLREVVSILLIAKVTNLTVWVLEKNYPARSFYHKQGFSSVPVKQSVIERGGAALVELKLRFPIGEHLS
ncbi:MAG: GNAT family N-acetyltransferase [Janthinobacterium lividum]